MTDEFAQFWLAYPRRIAKGAARKAFAIAIRKTTLETMLTALEAYKRNKPPQIDWCHASTWLNGERWLDEWEPPATIKPEPAFRKFRDLAEAVAYCRERFPHRVQLVQKCQSLDDLPIFLRVCPADWQPSNVTQMRRA